MIEAMPDYTINQKIISEKSLCGFGREQSTLTATLCAQALPISWVSAKSHALTVLPTDWLRFYCKRYGSQTPLNHLQLKAWHQMMSPVPQILEDITSGDYRNESVRVQSGRYGKEKIHFVTIHPFDDGNGRLSRIIAGRCLAEFEGVI